MRPNSFWKNCFRVKSQSYILNSDKFKNLVNFSSGQKEDSAGKEVKTAIGKLFDVPFEMVSIGNGSDEIIENIPRIFLETGDSVLIVAPTFFRFAEASLRMKAEVLKVFTREKNKFRFTDETVEKIIKIIKKSQPKIIWLCSPNNPTGEIMALSQIEKIAKKSKNLVVVDEAFHEIIDPENKKSAVTILKNNKNILVLKTFSKKWKLDSIGFGFAIGSPAIINILEKWRLPFNVASMAKRKAMSFLNKWSELSLIAKQTNINRRELFSKIQELKNLEIGADSKTNIFILRHKTKDIFRELLKNKILTADLRNLDGLKGKHFVRVTVKSKEENNILLEVLSIINL